MSTFCTLNSTTDVKKIEFALQPFISHLSNWRASHLSMINDWFNADRKQDIP